ncbi:MAG: hypothetical protein ABSC47_13230 [Terracidiphilus sp.]|jgi:hypothetical protein
MKDPMSNQRGNHGDGEIRDRKDIAEGEGQGFPVSIGHREFSHQEIGIKEKDDKRDLNQGARDAGGRLFLRSVSMDG